MRRRRQKQRYLTASSKRPEDSVPKESASVQLGEIVMRHPITLLQEHETALPRARKGKVIYIHPKGRFHVVEFGEGARAVRESFYGVG